MAIIEKGTKVYISADAPVTLLDGGEPSNERTIPNNEGNVKDYYGDLKQVQLDIRFQPGSVIGLTTGKTTVYQSTLYYQIILTGIVDRRTGHGLGAGTYAKTDWFGWASSADISDNESFALEKFNKRTDNATKTEIKAANINGVALGTGTTTNLPEPEPQTKKNNTGLFLGLGIGATALLATLIWLFTRK